MLHRLQVYNKEQNYLNNLPWKAPRSAWVLCKQQTMGLEVWAALKCVWMHTMPGEHFKSRSYRVQRSVRRWQLLSLERGRAV